LAEKRGSLEGVRERGFKGAGKKVVEFCVKGLGFKVSGSGLRV